MDPNTLAVQALPKLQVEPPDTLVTSVRLAELQKAIVTVTGDPDFAQAQEPVQDGVAYTTTDGHVYYRPLLRVADRGPGKRPGPDVWFLQDAEGVITLQWTLEAVPLSGGPDSARPLPISIDSVTMVWNGGSRAFDAPGVQPVESPAPGQTALRIFGGAKLRPDEAAVLEAAMNSPASACRLDVAYSYSYTVQVPQETPPDTSPPVEPRPPIRRPPWIDDDGGDVIRDHRGAGGPIIRDHRNLQQPPPPEEPVSAGAADVASIAAADVVVPARMTPALAARTIDPAVRVQLSNRSIWEILRPQQTAPDARRQNVVRSVPFVFEASQEANAPIYRALHDAANLTGEWTLLGDAGWLRQSDFPNTVFRLPDGLRLAWDAESGSPRMSPTLYRDAQGNPRVRLLLRLAPWQDPAKVVLTRKGVDLPAARVVIGPVDASTLVMGGSFPEELKVLGDGMAVPLTGADLTFDVSLSFYQFVCQVVSGRDGLPGRLDVTIGELPASDTSPARPRSVPLDVTIRLDKVDDLPCRLSVPDGVVSPTTVTVTNAAGADLTIGGCDATFLQIDPESVVPVDTYPARCTTPFPITVPAGGSIDLTLALVTAADDLVWNGVLVELLDKRLTVAASDVLKRVHELAAPGELSRDLVVSSPVFAGGTLPQRWADLVSIEVQISTGQGTPASVVLSLAKPSRTLEIPTTLADLVSGTPGGITTVTYQVRNNYADRQGAWSTPQQQSGEELVVYPNPADGG